jgi:hypothetical protein
LIGSERAIPDTFQTDNDSSSAKPPFAQQERNDPKPCGNIRVVTYGNLFFNMAICHHSWAFSGVKRGDLATALKLYELALSIIDTTTTTVSCGSQAPNVNLDGAISK